jgi:type IX secretion system PorP/SprF family membrane protein
MIKRTLIIAIFLSVNLSKLFAQDPEFTQFYANPLYLNPAFAGSVRCPRLVMNYRHEWPSISGTYITTSASYDQYVNSLHGGIGVLVMNDRAGEGTITTNNVSGIYSYHLAITRTFSIIAGFQGTFTQKKLDWSKLNFGDQINPKLGFIYKTQENFPDNASPIYADFSTGLLAYSNRFYGGFVINHLTEPNESFFTNQVSVLPRKYTGHLGMTIPLDREASISPNILYQQQQDFRQINFGLYMNRGPLVGGLWVRTSNRNADSFIALVGIQQGLIRFGYSYDITVYKLALVSGGSHELSLSLQFPCKPKKKKFRTISCPSF